MERQEKECRRLADRLGWPVAELYVDNDLSVSRYSRKRRPEYERMMADLASGARDAVIVYDVTRLYRRPAEIEGFITLADERGIALANEHGKIKLHTAEGRLQFRLMATIGAFHVEQASEKIRLQREQAAAAGLPHGGPPAFGYLPDKMHLHPDQAPLVRELVTRFLAGETPYLLARDLNDRGVLNSRGRPWRYNAMRELLVSPRIAGLRVHQGKVVGPAAWPAIVSVAEHERAVARMAVSKAPRGRPPKHLLAGLLTCGGVVRADGQPCGRRLYSTGSARERYYACSPPVGVRGCHGVRVSAHHVERFVTGDTLGWLDRSEHVTRGMREPIEAESGTAHLFEALSAGQAKLDELAEMFAGDEITKAQLVAASQSVRERMEETRQAIRRREKASLIDHVPPGVSLRDVWEASDVAWRRELLRAVAESIVVVPVGHVGGKFREDRVKITYR